MSTLTPEAQTTGVALPEFTVADDAMAKLVAVATIATSFYRPANQQVAIVADGTTVTAYTSAADNVAMEVTVAATVTAPGRAVVAADKLALLKSLKTDGTVRFAATETGHLSVRSGRRRGKVTVADIELTPLSNIDGVSVTVDADALVTLLTGMTKASTSSRPNLAGVHLSAADGTLTARSTDSYRLWQRTTGIVEDDRTAEALIGDSQIDKFLLWVAKDATGPVQLTFTNATIALRADGVRIEAPLINGAFPKLDQILDNARKATPTTVTVRVEDLTTELAQAMLFRDTAEADPDVALQVDPANADTLLLSISGGEGSCVVDGDVTGEALTIAANSKMLLEAAAAVKATGDAVVIGLSTSEKPLVMQSADVDADGTVTANGTTLVVQMPRRIAPTS